MTDTIETIAGSVVQHGDHNQRIYVMHLDPSQTQRLIPTLNHLAQERGYGKIFAKIPAIHWGPFKAAGYKREATVPGFFDGVVNGLFIAKFLSDKRAKTKETAWQPPQEINRSPNLQAKGNNPSVMACGPKGAVMLADLYRRVFKTYAFPIHQADYLESMMREDVHYFAVFEQKAIVAAAALEIDSKSKNCEMTDFATLPQFRGRGLAGVLLRRLDEAAVDHGLKTAYTIARADSEAMNRVFYQTGYGYAGRLINNTQISGRIRNMNVWYKRFGAVG